MRRPVTAARLTLLLAVALTAAAAAHRTSAHLSPAAATLTDCEGDACSQVTLTFDDTNQQYRAQNNSTDRWAKVSASNVAASASACLAPGTSAYLPLKSVVGTYSASFADVKCGAGPGT
jgi:hypothetical protein